MHGVPWRNNFDVTSSSTTGAEASTSSPSSYFLVSSKLISISFSSENNHSHLSSLWMISVKSYVQKPLMKSFILHQIHSSGHEIIKSKGTSIPPEGIGDGLQFKDFTLPLILLFWWRSKYTSRFLSELIIGFPAIKVPMFCFNCARIWIYYYLLLHSTKLFLCIHGILTKQLWLWSESVTFSFSFCWNDEVSFSKNLSTIHTL